MRAGRRGGLRRLRRSSDRVNAPRPGPRGPPPGLGVYDRRQVSPRSQTRTHSDSLQAAMDLIALLSEEVGPRRSEGVILNMILLVFGLLIFGLGLLWRLAGTIS